MVAGLTEENTFLEIRAVLLIKSKADNFQGFRHLYMQLKASKPHLKCVLVVTDSESDTLEFLAFAKQEGFILRLGSPHSGKAWLAERFIQIYRRSAKAQLLQSGLGPDMLGTHSGTLKSSLTALLPQRFQLASPATKRGRSRSCLTKSS